MSKRRDTGTPPFFRQAHLLPTPKRGGFGQESAAAKTLQRERERRAQTCFQEIIALLDRYGCTFQVIVQEIQVAGQAGVDRRTQVNILALDTPPAAAESGNGKPDPTPERGSK